MDGAKNFLSVSPNLLSVLLDSLLAVFYPQACLICEKSVESHVFGTACDECWKRTKIFDGTEIICEKCGKFLKFGGLKIQTFCHLCDTDFFDTARAVGLYDGAIIKTILQLKHTPFFPKYPRKFFIEASLKSPFQNADIIIPVPLSKARLVQRGFNQATFLAKILAKETRLEIDEKSLFRKIHTPKHRAGMDKKSRLESVKNAFDISSSNNIKNKKILLVDDVFTSGATASNCAEVLKEKGADKVYVLTVARAN